MKKKKKYIVLVLLIVAVLLLGYYGFSFAKYVSNSIWDYYLKSKGFYLTSDYLGPDLVKNVDNLWDGESVNFNIKNSLNQSVITDYDISYTVSCIVEGEAVSYAKCTINGTEFNTQNGVLTNFQTCSNKTGDGVNVSALNKTDCELGGYEWVSQISEKNLYFDVILTDNNYELNDVIVKINVNSTSPYHKKISGNFMLHKRDNKENNVRIDYKNYFNYDKLIISNSHSNSKCIKITWDSNKILLGEDINNFSSFGSDSNGYINEIKLNVNSKDSLSYIFYPRNLDITYNVTEFSVEESSGC